MSSIPPTPPSASTPTPTATPKAQSSKQTFQYGSKLVDYTLVKSKRRKTCEVIVDKYGGGGIVLRVPFEKTAEEIGKILNEKIRWALDKQKEYQQEIKEIVKPTFENNSTLPYMGKNYELQVVYYYYADDDNDDHNTENSKQNEKMVFMNSKFIACLLCNNGGNEMEKTTERENIRRLYNDWLCSEANKIFVEKVNQYSNKVVDVKPKRILIKNLKNRWGSVTKNQTINLNVNLMKAPEDIIDYIIIHELCHFKVKGHSYQFWDYLKQFVPYYKQKIEWLGRNTDSLLT